jgi:hypothetical protein
VVDLCNRIYRSGILLGEDTDTVDIERACKKKVVSPVAYWVCSIVGAYLLFIYGWLRMDFSIILGQVISYYIYLWNLNVKGQWKRTPAIFRIILYATPVVAFVLIALHGVNFHRHSGIIPLCRCGCLCSVRQDR